MVSEQVVETVQAALKRLFGREPQPSWVTIVQVQEETGLDEPSAGHALSVLVSRGRIEVSKPPAERNYPMVVTRIFY